MPTGVPESLLLSTRERYAVTLGLVVALVLPLIGLAVAGLRLGEMPELFTIGISISVIVLSSASMPLLSDIAQRAVLRGPLARLLIHLALFSTHLLVLYITILAVLFVVFGADLAVELLGPSLMQDAQSAFLCYAATAGMIRAIQWYRSSSIAEGERRALETAQLAKARDLVEQTLRPGMVVEALRAIGAMLPHHRMEAEEAVKRLARHGRKVTAILAEGNPHTDTPADPARPRMPMVRNYGSVYTWVVVFMGVSTCVSLYATTMPPAWMTVWAHVASAPIWLVAALPLIFIAERIVTLRWWIAAPALLLTAWFAGLAVSLVAIRAATVYVAAMSIPVIEIAPLRLLPLTTRHNVLIACAIAGLSFAFANGRQLLGAQARVGRMRAELASAELRTLEARIQPHFLFNALVSLLALIRLDPERAAGMCRLLSDLFARSVAASGVHEWPLREEMALTTDYLAVQHIRFGDRLVVRTAVDPNLHDRLIPRLILQPLVENAVKHGVARREEATHLTITVTDCHGALHLVVVNDCEVPHGPAAAGGGLTFVRSRVAAAGGKVDCDASGAGTFRVRCVLPG